MCTISVAANAGDGNLGQQTNLSKVECQGRVKQWVENQEEMCEPTSRSSCRSAILMKNRCTLRISAERRLTQSKLPILFSSLKTFWNSKPRDSHQPWSTRAIWTAFSLSLRLPGFRNDSLLLDRLDPDWTDWKLIIFLATNHGNSGSSGKELVLFNQVPKINQLFLLSRFSFRFYVGSLFILFIYFTLYLMTKLCARIHPFLFLC